MPRSTHGQETIARAAPRIAAFGEWDTANLGDRAILEGILDFFHSLGWSVDTYALGSLTPIHGNGQDSGRAATVAEALSTTPSPVPPIQIRRKRAQSPRTGTYLFLKQWLRPARQYWRIRRLLPQIGRAQAVLVGGGALLSDEHLHFPQSLAMVGWAARKLRLPVFCLGCSAEGSWSTPGERILVQFIRSCRVIAPRDAATARRVATIRGQPIDIFGDFALSRPASLKSNRLQSGIPRVAVNVMQLPQPCHAVQPFYEDVLVRTMTTWRHRHGCRRKGDIQVFTTGAPEDIRPASRVLARLSLPQACLYVPSALPSLRGFLRAHTTVVASRLHAAILSIAAGIPVVGLAVGPKLPAFFRTVGLERYSVPIQAEQASRRMLDLIDGRDLEQQPTLLDTAEIEASRAAIRSLLHQMEAGDAERQARHESVSVSQAFSRSRSEIDGGTDKAVHGLASGLAACGAQVTVLCEGPENSFLQSKVGYGIRCFAIDQHSSIFAVSKSLKGYIRHLTQQDLVILNGIFHPRVFGLSHLLRKRQIPYIVAPHDPYHPSIFRKNSHLKWPYWYLLERRMLRQARAIQVLESRHAQWLQRLRVNTPVIEIPNGFAPDEVCPEGALQWSETGVTRLFYLGRLDSHHKGLDLLIDAVAELSNTGALRLVMQGPDGGDRRHLEARAARLQLGDYMSFLNPDYASSAPEIIGNYDIFCLPSRFDGFGLSALEAMLAGRVLLVSEASGIAPYVQASGCGVVVQPEVRSIQHGLRELLQHRPKWRDMGMAGRQYVLTHLQWETLARRALSHYRHLVAVGASYCGP